MFFFRTSIVMGIKWKKLILYLIIYISNTTTEIPPMGNKPRKIIGYYFIVAFSIIMQCIRMDLFLKTHWAPLPYFLRTQLPQCLLVCVLLLSIFVHQYNWLFFYFQIHFVLIKRWFWRYIDNNITVFQWHCTWIPNAYFLHRNILLNYIQYFQIQKFRSI